MRSKRIDGAARSFFLMNPTCPLGRTQSDKTPGGSRGSMLRPVLSVAGSWCWQLNSEKRCLGQASETAPWGLLE